MKTNCSVYFIIRYLLQDCEGEKDIFELLGIIFQRGQPGTMYAASIQTDAGKAQHSESSRELLRTAYKIVGIAGSPETRNGSWYTTL